MTKKSRGKIKFGKVRGKEVIANFSGEKITSDAGILLMAELDKQLKITQQLAQCFQDYRNLTKIDYSVHQ